MIAVVSALYVIGYLFKHLGKTGQALDKNQQIIGYPSTSSYKKGWICGCTNSGINIPGLTSSFCRYQYLANPYTVRL